MFLINKYSDSNILLRCCLKKKISFLYKFRYARNSEESCHYFSYTSYKAEYKANEPFFEEIALGLIL